MDESILDTGLRAQYTRLMTEATTRDLWEGSPASRCKSSCYCPVPEVCYNLTPEEVATEVQRRKDAGFVVVERSQGGITAVTYERTPE